MTQIVNFTRSIRLTPSVQVIVFVIGILVVLIALHGQTVSGSFLSDDYDWVQNARLNWEQNAWLKPFTVSTGGNFYRPLIAFSFHVDYALFKTNPTGYHIHQLTGSLILIIGIAWLVWELTRDRRLAFGSAFLFAIWPSHHEVVTWLAGRPDLYATIFIVLSVASATRALQTSKWWYLGLSSVFAALGFLSKETAFIIPVIIISVVLVKSNGRPINEIAKRMLIALPSIALLGGALLIRNQILSDAIGGYQISGDNKSLIFSPNNLIKIFTSPIYLVNWDYAVDVFGQNALFGFCHRLFSLILKYWAILASLLGIALVGLTLYRRTKTLSGQLWFGLLWSVIAFIPVYGISDEINADNLTASRLFFTASIGYAASLAALFLYPSTSLIFNKIRIVSFWILAALFIGLWQVNVIPWKSAYLQMNQVASALRTQRTEILASAPDYLFFSNLPETIRGAYIFFGNNSLNELVYQTTGDPHLTALQVANRTYVGSPLCKKKSDLRVTDITWSRTQKKFIVDETTRLKLQMARTSSPPRLVWDFRDRLVAEAWDYADFEHDFTDSGVMISVPSNPARWIASPQFDALFGGDYQAAEIEFEVINASKQTGTRKIRMAWQHGGSYKSGDELLYGYGTKNSSVDQSIPLCRFLAWSLTDDITGIRLLPIQSGTIILKSVALR